MTPHLEIGNAIKKARNLVPMRDQAKIREALEPAFSIAGRLQNGVIIRGILEDAARMPGNVLDLLCRAEDLLDEAPPIFQSAKAKYWYR